ncbi:DUF3696 domain-containing protein [Shewanella sp. ISTPL2]|uniref:DUF3696 domain-containing protein n=1 Tax=Shewanella sp. ISTPL2 TaxID=2699425 RepID=UPI001569CAF9|nr:DUF3696 domain-containing protein [Shewanella sp. ISTPL2]
MLTIKSIKLINFKCYKSQVFDFTPLTVFCGNNSVGKSTAIQALGILLQSNFESRVKINGELVHIGGFKDIHNFSNKDESTLEVTIDSSVVKGTWGYRTSENRENLRNNFLPFIGSEEEVAFMASEDASPKSISYQFLQAERFGPRDNLPLSEDTRDWDWLGTKGEFTLEVLESLITKKRQHLDQSDTDAGDPRKHPSLTISEVFRNIQAWMGEIAPGYSINPIRVDDANVSHNTIDTGCGNLTKPINVGFGYSYSLGLVSALILAPKGRIVILENPEAHLHPRGQSYLGRLIALAAQAGVQVIVETHSDHLLNGMRVVARTHEDFDPSIFSLYYISKGNEQSNVEKITLAKDGKLSNWPDGFFDQQAQDMFSILTGKKDLPLKGK